MMVLIIKTIIYPKKSILIIRIYFFQFYFLFTLRSRQCFIDYIPKHLEFHQKYSACIVFSTLFLVGNMMKHCLLYFDKLSTGTSFFRQHIILWKFPLYHLFFSYYFTVHKFQTVHKSHTFRMACIQALANVRQHYNKL